LKSLTSYFCLALAGGLSACSPAQKTQPISLEIVPYYQQQALSCDLSFIHENQSWHINKLGVFISSASINNKLISFETSNWQTEQSALVWFNNNCQTEQHASEANGVIKANIDKSMLTSQSTLSFTIGIPFATNHENPLSQPSPLNNPQMFWSWQAGHKFLRLDAVGPDTNQSWAFHLGSVGCNSKSSLRPPSGECTQANRIKVSIELPKSSKEMTKEDAHTVRLKFDLGALLQNIDIASSESCMFSNESMSTCTALLQNLQNHAVFAVIQSE
jgi:uncharacterized repeat protein (TIGR04052 family)